jgi:succinoglycan biosynthesis transport protein ExoP
MRQTYYPASNAEAISGERREEVFGVWDIAAFLLQNRKTIAVFIAVTVAVALVYLLLATPMFVATTSVIVDTNRGAELFNATPIPPPMTSDQARVESQMEVIKSDRVANSVISRLKLEQRPEFASGPSIVEALLARITPTSTASAAGEGDRADSTELREVAARFADKLSTKRIGQSLVIEVAFSSADPDASAEIANATAESFIRAIVEAKSKLAEEQGKWLSERLETLQQQAFEAARKVNRFRSVGDSLSSQDARAKLEELESIASSYRRMYDDFQRQYNETLQRISYPDADVRIISRASAPLGKSSPRTSLVLGFAIILGGLSGTAFAAARSTGDRAVRSPKQSANVGVNPLGAINDLSEVSIWRERKLPWFSRSATARGTADTLSRIAGGRLGLSTKNDLRRIRTGIAALTANPDVLCIGVVACSDGEGATTVAACLANEYARSGARTILVDGCADSRTLSQELATGTMTKAQPNGPLESEPAIRPGALALALLPSAESYLQPDETNRRLTGRTAEVLTESRLKFERIVVDLPALLSSDQWKLLIPYVDQVIVVVDFGKTTVDEAGDGLIELDLAGGKVLGAVLNRVPAIVRKTWS